MKHIAKGILTAIALAALLALPGSAQADGKPRHSNGYNPPPQSSTCDNKAPRVRAVKLAAPTPALVDFSFSDGDFDPTPFLQTQIYVGGKGSSCVIAHFSALVATGDNTAVFQAVIDDVLMEGHGLYPADLRLPQLTPPVVIDKGLVHSPTNPIPIPTMASYNFFQTVKPGWHTVKIKWASCCTADSSLLPTVEALAGVLTLEYQGKDDGDDHRDDHHHDHH